MNRLCLVMLLLCTLSWPLARADSPVEIVYARVSGDNDPHLPYMQVLLQLACQKQHQHCILRAGPYMNQARAMQQLQRRDGGIDLLWAMTSTEREQQALPVRIPLYKGLIGWRVPLVSAWSWNRLARVRTVEDLKNFSAGQVRDWPDTAILQAGGLRVVESTDYGNLLPMLRQNRYDYFPRAVIEILAESRMPQAQGLLIEPHLVLHYPTAFYFFVSPQRPQLARLLNDGLEAAIADGSFEREFKRFNGDAIRTLKLSQRTVIELPNPFLPLATPLARQELWFRR